MSFWEGWNYDAVNLLPAGPVSEDLRPRAPVLGSDHGGQQVCEEDPCPDAADPGTGGPAAVAVRFRRGSGSSGKENAGVEPPAE